MTGDGARFNDLPTFRQCGEPFALLLRPFQLWQQDQRYRVVRRVFRQLFQCFAAVNAGFAVWNADFQQFQAGKQ